MYYAALEQSQDGWHEGNDDPTPFIKYLLSTVIAAYRDFEERMDIVSDSSSAMEMVKKAIKTKIGKFTKTDIVALCPSISASSVENSLKKLSRSGEITKHGRGRTTFYTRNV